MSSAGQQLNRRQWDVLKYVHDAIVNQGYPPSIREIAEALGTSLSTVHHQLEVLEQKGFIYRTSYKSHTSRRKLRDIEIRLPLGERPDPVDNELDSTQRRVLDFLQDAGRYGPPPPFKRSL
jgi:SOS-response transcriptional repressor LexA